MAELMKRGSRTQITLFALLLTAGLILVSCGGGGGGAGTDTPADSAPGAPTGLVASVASAYQINLSWDASGDSDIASYRVYRGAILLNTVSHPTTTASDTGLSPSTRYCYTVHAVDTSNKASVASAQNCTTTLSDADMEKPSMPASLSITVTSPTSVSLSWAASADNIGVAGYRLYKDGIYLKSVTSGMSATDAGLTTNREYCYTVSAYDAANNESDKTGSACGTPLQSAPAWIIATAGDGQNTISWSEMSYAVSYNVYFSTELPVTKSDGTIVVKARNPYVHKGLDNGTTYYYVVTAVGAGGESAESEYASATPAAMPAATGKLPDTGQTTSYTATAGEDHDYLINAPSYSDNGDGTITDNVTGLVWQQQDDGDKRSWYDAGTYCNSNTAGLPGTGWRVPTRMELLSIADYAIYAPAINTTFFPNTQAFNEYYWSSGYDPSKPDNAKRVGFRNGSADYELKITAHHVRCVRGQAGPASGYTNNGNGTITDNVTGLVWQQQDDADTKSWEEALAYCEDLSFASYTDWRLPNVKELSSLVSDGRYGITIDPLFSYAKKQNTDYYWTSSTWAAYANQAWRVSFYSGSTSFDTKTYNYSYKYYARCVRGQ